MSPRTIAIGDIHGCSNAFLRLLEAIDPQSDDTLVTLGDYVDRGPDTRGVIDRLLQLPSRCRLVTLLGNHEQMLLEAWAGRVDANFWLACGGLATLKSYGAVTEVEQIPSEHIEFIENCRLFYEQDAHFFVHANYLPDEPLEEQGRDMLLWRSLRAFTPGPHCSGKTAVVGHTCQPEGEIFDLGYLKCIDTCCYRQGWLTALDVDSGRIWQANQDGDLRS